VKRAYQQGHASGTRRTLVECHGFGAAIPSGTTRDENVHESAPATGQRRGQRRLHDFPVLHPDLRQAEQPFHRGPEFFVGGGEGRPEDPAHLGENDEADMARFSGRKPLLDQLRGQRGLARLVLAR
jgi:hypothetical protein